MSVTAWSAPKAKCDDCKSWPALEGERLCEFCLPYYQGRTPEAMYLAKHQESAGRRAGTDRRETP